jgi:hypothetical protein
MQKFWDTLRRRHQQPNYSQHQEQSNQETAQSDQETTQSDQGTSVSPSSSLVKRRTPLAGSPHNSSRRPRVSSPPSPSLLVSLAAKFSGSLDRCPSGGDTFLSKTTSTSTTAISASSNHSREDGEGGSGASGEQHGSRRPTRLSWNHDNQRGNNNKSLGNKNYLSRGETISVGVPACSSSSTTSSSHSFLLPWERQHKGHQEKNTKKYEEQKNKHEDRRDNKELPFNRPEKEKVSLGFKKLFDVHRSHFPDKHDNRSSSLKEKNTCSSHSPSSWKTHSRLPSQEDDLKNKRCQESLLLTTSYVNTVDETSNIPYKTRSCGGRPLSSVVSAPASCSPTTTESLTRTITTSGVVCQSRDFAKTCIASSSSTTTFSSLGFLTTPPLTTTSSPIHLLESAASSSSKTTSSSSSTSADSVSLFAFCSPSTPNKNLPSNPFPGIEAKGFQKLVDEDTDGDDDDEDDADIFEQSLNYHLMSYRKEKEEEERMSGRDISTSSSPFGFSVASMTVMQEPVSSDATSLVSNRQVPKSPTTCVSPSHSISSSSTSAAKRVLMKIRGVGSSVVDKTSKETGSGSAGSSGNPSPRTSTSSYDDQGSCVLTVSPAGNVSLKSSSASSTNSSSGSASATASTVVHAIPISGNNATECPSWGSSSSVSPAIGMNRVMSKIDDNSSCSSFLSPSPSSEILEFAGGISAGKSSRSKSFDSATVQQQNLQHNSSPAVGGSVGENVASSGSTTCLSTSGSMTGRRNRTSGGLLEIPKWKMFIRRSSAGPTASSPQQQQSLQQQTANSPSCSTTSLADISFWKDCVHCVLLEEFNRNTNANLTADIVSGSSMIHNTWPSSSSSPPFDQNKMLPTRRSQGSLSSEGSQDSDPDVSRSDASRKSASGESLDILDDEGGSLGSSVGSTGTAYKCHSPIPLLTLSIAPEPEECCPVEEDLGNGVTVISLEVPVLPKSGRSASMDSSYLQVPRRHDVMDFEPPPGKSNRSRSVDIALPVGSDGPYIIVPSEKPVPATTQ